MASSTDIMRATSGAPSVKLETKLLEAMPAALRPDCLPPKAEKESITERITMPLSALLQNMDLAALEPTILASFYGLLYRYLIGSDPGMSSISLGVADTILCAEVAKHLHFDDLIKHVKDIKHEAKNQKLELDETKLAPHRQIVFVNGRAPEVLAKKQEGQLKVYFDSEQKTVAIDFNPHLFSPAYMARFREHWQNLLKAAIDNPHVSLAEIDLLTEEDKKFFKESLKDNKKDFKSEYKYVHEILEAAATAKDSSDRPAIIFYKDDKLNKDSLTYRELNEIVSELASFLIHYQPQAEPKRVGMCLARGVNEVLAEYAIYMSGHTAVPYDFRDKMLEDKLKETNPDVIFVDDLTKDSPALLKYEQKRFQEGKEIKKINLSKNNFKELNKDFPQERKAKHTEHNLVYLRQTTGLSKWVMIKHEGLNNFACVLREMKGLPQHAIVLSTGPHTADPPIYERLQALVKGGPIVMIYDGGRTLPEVVAEVIIRERINAITLTPKWLAELLKNSEDRLITLFSSMTHVTIMGEEPSEEDMRKLRLYLPANAVLVNGYGPTETTVGASLGEYSPDQPTTCIGYPFPNYQFYVVSPHWDLCPPGVPGELCIGGRSVAAGFLNEAKLTANSFPVKTFDTKACRFLDRDEQKEKDPRYVPVNLYKTGDCVVAMNDKKYDFVSRYSHGKIRGRKIVFPKIATLLGECKDVQDVAVVGSQDRQSLHAYVVLRGSGDFKTPEDRNRARRELLVKLNSCLEGKEHPDIKVTNVVFVDRDNFLTSNGKVRKFPPITDALADSKAEYVPTQPNTTQAKIEELWYKSLGRKEDELKIGLAKTFSEIGGDSQAVCRLYNSVQTFFKITIAEYSHLSAAMTIEQMATTVEEYKSRRPNISGPDVFE